MRYSEIWLTACSAAACGTEATVLRGEIREGQGRGEPWPTCTTAHVRWREIVISVMESRLPDPAPPPVRVLQLYARDIPDLPFLEGADLLRVLWCPNKHGEPWYGSPVQSRKLPGKRDT